MATPPPPRFRRATPADAPAIRALVWGARMNPLALDPARFLVLDSAGDGGGDATSAPSSSPSPSLDAIGQLVPLEEGGQAPSSQPAVEVRSLVVAPARRGAGLGTSLLAALLDSAPPGTAAWLTTLAGRAPFYERAGFRVVAGREGAASLLGGLWGGGAGGMLGAAQPAIPPSLRFEVLAGSLAAPLLGGDRLVVMRRDL